MLSTSFKPSVFKDQNNKDHNVLFYCNGVKCGRSVVAVGVAKKCGYSNIYWFRGGFEAWLKEGFPFVKE